MKTGNFLCLVDSATTQTIFKDRKVFHTLTEKRGSVTTIANDNVLIVGFGRASLIDDALLYSQSTRTVLSFKDI